MLEIKLSAKKYRMSKKYTKILQLMLVYSLHEKTSQTIYLTTINVKEIENLSVEDSN